MGEVPRPPWSSRVASSRAGRCVPPGAPTRSGAPVPSMGPADSRRRIMRKAIAVLATTAALLGAPAHAAATFEFLFDNGYALSVSNDGSVVVGNSNDGTFTSF